MRPDIIAIKARCEAATPEPWEVFGDADEVIQAQTECSICDFNGIDLADEPNSLFIAHARTDVPALLSYIAELERVGGEMAQYFAGIGSSKAITVLCVTEHAREFAKKWRALHSTNA